MTTSSRKMLRQNAHACYFFTSMKQEISSFFKIQLKSTRDTLAAA